MIVVNLDVVMAQRKMTLSQLAEKVDITLANLSILKNNKAKAVRFSTLEAICAALDCQPGDILEYVPDVPAEKPPDGQWYHARDFCLLGLSRADLEILADWKEDRLCFRFPCSQSSAGCAIPLITF